MLKKKVMILYLTLSSLISSLDNRQAESARILKGTQKYRNLFNFYRPWFDSVSRVEMLLCEDEIFHKCKRMDCSFGKQGLA